MRQPPVNSLENWLDHRDRNQIQASLRDAVAAPILRGLKPHGYLRSIATR